MKKTMYSFWRQHNILCRINASSHKVGDLSKEVSKEMMWT